MTGNCNTIVLHMFAGWKIIIDFPVNHKWPPGPPLPLECHVLYKCTFNIINLPSIQSLVFNTFILFILFFHTNEEWSSYYLKQKLYLLRSFQFTHFSATVKYIQVGMVSGGVSRCGDPDIPSYFTRLDHPEIANFIAAPDML